MCGWMMIHYTPSPVRSLLPYRYIFHILLDTKYVISRGIRGGKRKVGYKCDFFADYDSSGGTKWKSGGCHFGTLEQFFYLPFKPRPLFYPISKRTNAFCDTNMPCLVSNWSLNHTENKYEYYQEAHELFIPKMSFSRSYEVNLGQNLGQNHGHLIKTSELFLNYWYQDTCIADIR